MDEFELDLDCFNDEQCYAIRKMKREFTSTIKELEETVVKLKEQLEWGLERVDRDVDYTRELLRGNDY